MDQNGIAPGRRGRGEQHHGDQGDLTPFRREPVHRNGALVDNSAATVVVAFGCLIRSFTVTFDNTAASPAGPQWVGISDILWCA